MAFKFKSSKGKQNKRKTTVENGGKREKLFFPEAMERTAEKWVVWEQKKEKNQKVSGFFDSERDEFEPLHGTRGTVSVTKHVGKKKEINYGELDFNSI